MIRTTKPARLAFIGGLLLLVVLRVPSAGRAHDTLPASLTDQEFWSLIGRFSEPDGYFRSNSGSPDNLLSNENTVSTVAADLARRVKPSGVYLGVGPEQNFTYIAATQPRFAVITDIRRGNLQLHLMYKALFELSSNRADFAARLFNRPRPAGLTTRSTVVELMDALGKTAPGGDAAFEVNLKAITNHLTRTRRLPLGDDDLAGIKYVYANFHKFGPAIHYTSSIGGLRSGTSYAALMTSMDFDSGAYRTYLASEENFATVKALQSKNLILPIVGDFAGPKALRAIGMFLRERAAIVTTFYVSNVEMYLQRNGVWRTFCANVASLPLDSASLFVRPGGRGFGSLSSMAAETANCEARPARAR